MKCKICGSEHVTVSYTGPIRNGGLGKYTNGDVTIWKCNECDTMWHDPMIETTNYYESTEYRLSLEGTSNPDEFYTLHDKESKWKFDITGTTIFRNKNVMDIGCGAGGYLDYLKGIASCVYAIEPSAVYREEMTKKGIITYPYAIDALGDGLVDKIDVIVSFDVIEHVNDPIKFLEEAYNLLSVGGTAIIGTPTDAPIMRELLGVDYEMKLLFSTQHLWIFGKKNLQLMAKKIGCISSDVRFYQRYGVGNFIGWIKEKRPQCDVKSKWITKGLDGAWKGYLEDIEMADYIVLYMKKE